MRHASWDERALGAALAFSVQALFLLLVLFSPSHRPKPAGIARETILFFPPLATPSTIDARGPRRKRAAAPSLVPVPPPIVAPPEAGSPPAPSSGLAGFGRSLFGCAPERYADLTPEERAHCPKPGEGLAKNDDRDLLTAPRSHAKLEAMWQEQWDEDHWMPAACLPGTFPGAIIGCQISQARAENQRAAAAWEKIDADRAAALKPKAPPVPPSVPQSQNASSGEAVGVHSQ